MSVTIYSIQKYQYVYNPTDGKFLKLILILNDYKFTSLRVLQYTYYNIYYNVSPWNHQIRI